MKNRLLMFSVFGLLCVCMANAQEDVDDETAQQWDEDEVLRTDVDTPQTMEDLIVTGVRDEVFNAFKLDDFHRVHNRGEYYYRTRQYKKAFPFLLASAKRGFKMAQARVAFIYMNGLGVVKPSKAVGIGWLGVAASPRSDPEIKNHFKEVMSNIPEHLLPQIEELVEDFIARYGSDTTGLECMHSRVAGSHVSTLKCNFETEFDVRDHLFQDWLGTGLGEGMTPFTTGFGTSDPTGQGAGGGGGGSGGSTGG